VRLRFLEIDEYLEGTYQRGSQARSERREMTQMCEGWEKQRGRLVGLRDQGQLLARLAGSTVYWGGSAGLIGDSVIDGLKAFTV
jgi:hypothetical protein